jgi:hypothetical protein
MTLENAARAVLQERDPSALIDLLGLQLEETPTLRPGTDYRDGHLYMTVPVDRLETKTVGRGKSAKEIEQRVVTTLSICDDGTFFLYDEENVARAGFRFPQTFTQDLDSRWQLDDLKKFLQGERTAIDAGTLFREIREIYQTYVEYPADIYYTIVPLFIMGSYVFRLFTATGYIHFNGTMASGKSQNLRLLAALALNTVWASNMTSAALFRQVAGCPGVICIDEAESFEGERGQELRQILLSGYNEGSAAGRAEKGAGDRFVVVKYETFAPKVLASINPLEPVLASRCLIVPMAPAIRTIPDFNQRDTRWQEIRNHLYRWAMQEATTVARVRDSWDPARRTAEGLSLNNRAWEIAQFYLTIAEHVGGAELVGELKPFFEQYFASQARAQTENNRQYTLLKALPRVLVEKQPHPGFYYSVKDIHEIVSSYLEEDAREYYKTRTVSRHLTVLGFTDRHTAKGGTQVQLIEADIRAAFLKRHVEPFDEDAEWLAGARDYQTGSPPTPSDPPPAPDESLSWLDQYAEGFS